MKLSWALLAIALMACSSPSEARFPHGSQSNGGGGGGGNLPTSCPKGLVQSDFGGTPDDCASATQNPSYQNTSFFGTGAGNARQSSQSAYFYDDTTITWNIPCIDNGCGYDTTKLVNDPIDISFSASSGTITGGVLTVSDAALDATNGHMSVGEYVATGGAAPTISSPKTVSLTSHTGGVQVWQLNQNVTVAGTPSIIGRRFPQIACDFRTSIVGTSSVPIVNCSTTGDATTPTVFDGYDGTIEGIWFRLVTGSGAGANGLAGPITISNSKFIGTTACNTPSISTAISGGVHPHHDFYILHNQFDGNWPTCLLTAALSNQTTGTSSQHQVFDMEWNVYQNIPVTPNSGAGDYTGITIANNAFVGQCLERTQCKPTGLHGAVYANSVAAPMDYYIYKHNIALWGSQVGASSVTTSFSILANASGCWQCAIIGDVEFLGNISVTNCQDGPCTGSNKVASLALWSNVDPVAYGHLTSTSNLMDLTGAAGGVYTGGNSRLKNRGTGVCYASPAMCIVTLSVNQDNWQPNSFVHVNSTPFTMNGTITPNGDGTGALVLDSANASLTTNSIAGVLVPPGMYIFSKTDNTHFTVKNFFGTTNALLTAPHQAMYTAFTVIDPSLVTDPATGSHPTGTGRNVGTYAIVSGSGAGTIADFATWNRFNPAIGSYPPTINTGTDRTLTGGGAVYMGGANWAGGIAP